MPDDILGVHELAELAGVLPRTMSAYVSRGQCPAPDYVLKCGPIWRRETAERWIAKRDERLERIQAQTAKEIERETKAATEYVNFYMASKRETAKRNARNAKAKRGRSKYLAVPTVREEARRIAERMIGDGDSSLDGAILTRHNWSTGLLQNRQARRLGCDDGIPF